MSGIYIKGMEMPKDGTFSIVHIYSDGHVSMPFWEKGMQIAQGINAIPVPDHGDLIDRGYAIATACSGLTRTEDGERWIRVKEVRESIKAAPTIIPTDKEVDT